VVETADLGNLDDWAEVTRLPLAVYRTVHVQRLMHPGSLDRAGKADAVGEETGMSTPQTAVIGARASKERHAEITSGRTISQQGLATTCKDPPTKGNRRRWEGFGLSHEVI